nr:putative keratin-associated protein 20-4 [Callithrix jacchus]
MSFRAIFLAAWAVAMGRTVAVAEYGRCGHGCQPSCSAR